MKYMLLTYLDENAWLALSKEQQQAEIQKCEPHVKKLLAAGKILDGAPLHPTSTATTVTVKQGKRLVTDGPFAETSEQLGGYYLVDVPNIDEAIAIAGRIPAAKKGTVEIRPVFDLPDMPQPGGGS